MTEREFKDTLRASVEAEMPDLLPRIQKSCAEAEQVAEALPMLRRRRAPLLRIAALAACFVLFFAGIAVGRLLPGGEAMPAAEAETYLYMDVNPSVELQLDGEGRVVACEAGNEDAEALLGGLDLIGVERNTALAALLGSMYINGYLTPESNSVLLSVDTPDGEVSEEMLNEITEEIHAVFAGAEMDCAVIAQRVEVSEELMARAEEYGVSVGKMHLIEKMVGEGETPDEKDLAGLASMSIGELNWMYAAGDDFADDVVSGFVNGFLQAEEALSSLLDAVSLKEILLDEYETSAGYAEVDGAYRPVYEIRLRMKYTGNEYHFTVDCETGELIASDIDLNIPFPDLGIGE